ncbi:MAG TPA: BON domain-containing protein [Acidimicrobiales bacterium]|nr:BON domain-containing protein [Acidimicrobiales bacterium]
MTRCRRSIAPLVALLVVTGGVAAAVRAWRRRQLDEPVAVRPASDAVVADRIRSELGLVEHRLDIPRIHVMVERGVALLHGEVPTEDAAHVLEARVRAVAGVQDLVSHLHVGLLAGDTRPSADESRPSVAARRLTGAALAAGAGEVTAALAARRVLTAFAATLPMAARRRIRSHLPADVSSWLPADDVVSTTGTVDELYGEVAAASVMPATHVPFVVEGVLRELASLVPDDAEDVAVNLPAELGHLWADAAPESS